MPQRGEGGESLCGEKAVVTKIRLTKLLGGSRRGGFWRGMGLKVEGFKLYGTRGKLKGRGNHREAACQVICGQPSYFGGRELRGGPG